MKKLIASTVGTVLALAGLGVATAAPASAATHDVQPSCSFLYIALDDYPDGTTVVVEVDGETVHSTTFGGSSGFSHDYEWSTPHEWSVEVDAPDGVDGDFSDGGTTTPCDTDPHRYADATASCGEVTVNVSSYPVGTRVVVSLDGETVADDPVDGNYWNVWPLDWTVAHTWSVTLDASDDALDLSWEGVTEPCDVDPNLRVDVSAYCDQLSVNVDGYPAGTAVVVTVAGETVGEGSVDEWGYFWGWWPLDDSTTHDWTVTLDAADDAFDRVESGTSLECWTEPGTVVPETPATLTACDATPDDVLLPTDTEAISYTRTPEGIVATAAPGHVFPSLQELEQWRLVVDGQVVIENQVLLDWFVVVRPRCDLDVVSVTPVCDDGVPSVDVVVTPPPGAGEDSLMMDWVGPDGGYDVVYGSAGFGQPFESRQPWPAWISNEDGTVSPHHTPDWRLDDVDLAFGVSVWVDGWTYSRYHRAVWEGAPTADPCADDPGPHFSVDARERRVAGKTYLAVRVLNEDDTAAEVTVTTPFGTRTFRDVAPGTSAYQSFAVRSPESQGVPVAVGFATEVDGQVVTRERVVTAWVGG